MMKILDLGEDLLPIGKAVQKVCHRSHHNSTTWRWAKRGLLTPDGERVRLEYVKCGGQPLTSVEAVRRFFAATTGEQEQSASVRTNRQREAALARAEAECESLGI